MSYYQCYPKDWTNQEQVFAYLEELIQDGRVPHRELSDAIRYGLPIAAALELVVSLSRRYRDNQRMLAQCVAEIGYAVQTHEDRVVLMNKAGIFQMLTESMRIRIRDSVLENGDLSRLGVGWAYCFGHATEMFAMQDLVKNRFIRTHAVECIMELGDGHCQMADAILAERMAKGMGPDPDMSVITTEFLSAARVLKLGGIDQHIAVGIASEQIERLVGRQTKRERELGCVESQRTAHLHLKSVHVLLDLITGLMTSRNAGIVLRWALLTGGKRHREFVWNHFKDALRRNHWRICRVVKIGDEFGVEWHAAGLLMRALPVAGQSEVGELRLGMNAMVSGFRALGEPVEYTDTEKTWRTLIHPLTPPTEAMRKSPSIF